MRKFVTTLFLLGLALTNNSFGQATAVDFTANDCGGTSHHLFSELDAGSILVLVFVMPCDGCITPSLNVGSVVSSFAASNPGKVGMYLVDDDGATTCSTLSGWRNSHGIGLVTTFSSPDVVQTQYGTPGMPKVVVLGGTGHYVYFNENYDIDTVKMRKAINDAIAGVVPAPTQVTKPDAAITANLFPNPAQDKLLLTYDLPSATDITVTIYSETGSRIKIIQAGKQSSGRRELPVNVSDLANGNYVIKLQAGGAEQAFNFVVAK